MNRFHSKYEVLNMGHESPCWMWRAYKDKHGYGRFQVGDRPQAAHRYSWFLVHGYLPEYPEFELDHLCGNRACVNPDHLRVATHKENTLRSASFVAENSEKLYCKNGHEYNQENTYIRPNGARDCRACGKERVRRYKQGRASA